MTEFKTKKYAVQILDQQESDGRVYYLLQLNDPEFNDSWILKYRFSEILVFHQNLRQSLGSKPELPEFPPKKWLGNKSKSFVSERRIALQIYFNRLLEIDEVWNQALIKVFLHFDQASQSKILSASTIVVANTQHKLSILIEKFSNKFVYLATTFSAPDEEQVKQRRQEYDKIQYEPSRQVLGIFELPKRQRLSQRPSLDQSAFARRRPSLLKELGQLA